MCDRYERNVVPVKHLDQLGKVHQRAGQAVDLVDDHHIDAVFFYVGKQPLQRRAVQRAPGDAAVIVVRSQFDPALGALAGDIGAARVALRIERVELLLEPFLARFSRVDGAAEFPGDRFCRAGLCHARPRLFLSPKNRQPFQRVPVMARAIADSDW